MPKRDRRRLSHGAAAARGREAGEADGSPRGRSSFCIQTGFTVSEREKKDKKS